MLGAIDIGYGAVKIVKEGGYHTTFPSVTGSADLPRFGLTTNKAIVISDGFARTLVGQGAVEQSRFIHREEDRNWINSNQYLALYYAALTELQAEGEKEITLISGLPLAYYDDKEDLQALLTGTHKITRDYNGKPSTALYTVKAYVIPQPFGTLCTMALNELGAPMDPVWMTGTVGILDIGSHTTNVLMASRASEISHGTTSIATGCWDLIRAVSARLSDLFPQLERRPHELAQDIRRGLVTYQGDKYDISEVVRDVCLPMAAEIVSVATQHWNGGASLDRIAITGGGAHLIGSLVQDHFEQHKEVHIPDNPVYANAEGYLRYGLYLRAQGAI